MLSTVDSNEHQNLVGIIRNVHQKLRKDVLTSCDPDKVWAEHLRDQELREKYSHAMFKLATQIWDGKESRIEWTYKTCVDYFYYGGLERSLLRQLKLRKLSLLKDPALSSIFEENEDIVQQHNYCNFNHKLKLLDVGSCYNPFRKYKEFSCTAIDLTPATEDVLQFDFLSVAITPKVEDNLLDNKSSRVFVEENFDIVVLSLVLEYLPTPKQRTLFCYKSWQLLQENGLCIIITPDSKSVNHNVHMIKCWKLALEKIGFLRVKYDKLKHVHCMAFRKLKRETDEILQWDSVSDLLYIPQDFNTYTEKENVERTEEEIVHIRCNFLELPNEDLF